MRGWQSSLPNISFGLYPKPDNNWIPALVTRQGEARTKTTKMIMKTLCYWSLRIPVHKATACRCIALLFSSVLLFPISAKAVGFRLPNQDPEAIARGNAFVATADNPSAIYYNPAGITQLEGNNLRAGIY